MDTPLDPLRAQELLDQAPWVRRLARTLVGADGDPDDVVQETWVTALTRGPRADDGRGRRAWLGSVVRNHARMRGRSERARGARERSAAGERPELPPPDEVLGRVEAQRALVDS